MRLIDAEDSELQTQLKIIREAEYQIYGSGSWGFTAKCEHAIEDAPTIQPEPHWIPVTERLPETTGEYLVTKREMYTHRLIVDIAVYFVNDGWHKADPVIAWMPLPEPYKGVTE